MGGSYTFPTYSIYAGILNIMNYACYSTSLACVVQNKFYLNFCSCRVFFCMKLCYTMLHTHWYNPKTVMS